MGSEASRTDDRSRADSGERRRTVSLDDDGIERAHAQADSGSIEDGGVVAGKYRIERALGAGGMGRVYEARHLALGHKVALKFLKSVRPEALSRFRLEARIASRLESEHIGRVHDVDATDDGLPFLVMDLLEGRTLADALKDRKTLPIDEACDVVIEACEAVAKAHLLGIVHRDLKPANLFLCRSGTLKVLDFGIAKLVEGQGDHAMTVEGEDLTGSSSILGSPVYMSPEQVRDPSGVDLRADVWALGTVLFELVAGRTPFSAPTSSGVLAAIVADPCPKLGELAPDAPRRLELAVERCLAKDPEQRTQSIAELARALAPFASERGKSLVASIPSVHAPGAVRALDSSSADAAAIEPRPEARAWARGAALAVAAIVVAIVATTALRHEQNAPSSASPAPPSFALASTTSESTSSAPTSSASADVAPASSTTVSIERADATAPKIVHAPRFAPKAVAPPQATSAPAPSAVEPAPAPASPRVPSLESVTAVRH